MNTAWSLLRMLRLPNLIIVFLSQSLPYWLVLRPALLRTGAVPALNTSSFAYLTLCTLSTTLAGYLINDYFDREIDAINRPNRVVVGRILPAEVVLYLYWILLTINTLLSLRLFFLLPAPHAFWPLWLFPAVSLGLFLYAWTLKCTPVIGNMLVAFLCGLVPIIPLVPEDRPIWLSAFRDPDGIHRAVALVWLFALFAFFTNLWRELVKDLEDFPGDAQCRCNTLAVVKGPRAARVPAGITGLGASALIGILLFFWRETNAPQWQLIAGAVLLLLPALVATGIVFRARGKQHYSIASALIKLIMVAGLFLLVRDWPGLTLKMNFIG